jgi:hypothetical protein
MSAWADPQTREKVEVLLTGGGEILRAIEDGAGIDEEIAEHIEADDRLDPETRAAILCAHENAAILYLLQDGPASKQALATQLHHLTTKIDNNLVNHLDDLGSTVDTMIAHLDEHGFLFEQSNERVTLNEYGSHFFRHYVQFCEKIQKIESDK